MKKTYCELCGQIETWVGTRRFKKESGEEILKGICTDTGCPRGCEQNGGHEYKEPEELFPCTCGQWFGHAAECPRYDKGRMCQRCGEDAPGCMY